MGNHLAAAGGTAARNHIRKCHIMVEMISDAENKPWPYKRVAFDQVIRKEQGIRVPSNLVVILGDH